jgi:hypothetical protein
MLISGASIMASLGASALAKVNALTAPKAADAASGSGVSAAADKSAKDEFLDYAKMTPAEKMRAAMLGKLGVTEEQLKAMSPEERKKVEDKIKDMIKQQVENDPQMKKGSILDVKA